MEHVEQRICLRFCVLNGITCTNALKMLRKTYGEKCMSKTQAYNWYKSFKAGREKVHNLERSGRPSTATNEANIKKVKALLSVNPQVREREIAKEVGISHGSVHNILVNILRVRSEVLKKPSETAEDKNERVSE